MKKIIKILIKKRKKKLLIQMLQYAFYGQAIQP